MACVINTIAHFIDVVAVKKYLFPKEHRSDTDDNRVHGDAWVWPDDDIPSESSHKVDDKTMGWLQDCCVSLSATTELLVIARGKAMVILTSKWNFQEEGDVKTKYHITWHGNPGQGQSEQITSVLCLPLLSQGKSSQCGPDWTCIVVGFSSGYIRFYTENCSLLTSEMLHNEEVLYLKCQAYQPASCSTSREPAEELYVTYSTAVCIIPGFGLFQTLRACRNQLARVQANCGEKVQAPPLTFKKLGFQDQSVMTDCEVAGPATANTFDHLLTASICGGFNTWYRSSAPQTSLVVAAGKKPFVAFHYALEGGAPPVLADVAKVMANKLKSALGQAVPSWLLGGRKSQPADKNLEVAMEPAEPMGCRFGLCDAWRDGSQIVLAPHRTLCVVCDTLGRITLIDTLKGVALRMWKGYRDAQCGWMEVKEDSAHRSSGSQQKVALFLVIYSPKKGIIEVWTMQQGPKIATFPVSKTGRLVYTNYGLMGLNNTHLKGGNKCQFPCIFIDPAGTISEIIVPFHFALSAKNSKRVRDLHLLKKLKTFMKEQEFDSESLCEEVRKTFEELRTIEIRIQALEALSGSRVITPDAMQAALQVITQQQGASSGPEEPGGKILGSLTSHLQCLVAFYSRMHILNEKPPDYNSTLEDELLPEMLTAQLSTPPEDVTRLVNLFTALETLIDRDKPRAGARVTFGESSRGALVEFLSCFELSGNNIRLKTSANEDKLERVGGVLLEGALIGAELEEWSAAVKSSCVEPMDLVQLALRYWLSRVHPLNLKQNIGDMLRLAELLKVMCDIAGRERVFADNNQVSPWWQEVRTTLMCSANPWGALTAAVVCRSVALSVERGAAADDHCDWEHVSFDTCQWGVLNARLEDVAILAAIVNQHTDREAHSSGEKPEVSLKAMLARGKGAVAELAAGWLANWVKDPNLLLTLTSQDNEEEEPREGGVQDGHKLPQEEGSDAVKLSGSSGDASLVLNLMRVGVLRQHFPYSMADSILLANLCWEHMVAWSRGVSEVATLEKAISCLQNIPSPHLRQGLCSLIWAMHLRPPLEASTMLIQRVGRTPKERLCRQEVGLPDTAMAPFLQHCLTFLDVFLEVCGSGDELNEPSMKMCEELWDGGPSGPPPLAELALTQPQANYDLLHLHYQLAMMLQMLVTFNLKLARPLSTLLDVAGQAALFSDLSGRPRLPSHHPDTPLVTARTHFLCRVVSAAVQTVQTVDAEAGLLDAAQAVHWMSRCLALGSTWSVSNDVLRRHQICELYSNGFDRLAEELIPAVSDTSLLASQLLLIVGQRMRYIVHTSPDLCDKLSKLSAALSTWLQTMPEDQLKSMNTSLSDIALLLVPVMQYLSDDHQEYELALNMVDAVHAFQDAVSTA